MATLAITLGIIAIAVALFVYLGSTWFIIPLRRGLEPRHHAVLANPSDHGLSLEPIRVKTKDDFSPRRKLRGHPPICVAW